MFTWTSLGLEQHPAGISAKLCVERGVEVWGFKSWKCWLLLGAAVVYPPPSFGSVEQWLWSCSALCHASLECWSVRLEHHKHTARVLGSRVLDPAVSTCACLSLVWAGGACSPLCLSHQKVPECCHELAVASLKLSVFLGWRNLSWLGGSGGVEVEFGELCQIVNIPYKQETWWFLGSLQHLRGVMVLLLTSTLAK